MWTYWDGPRENPVVDLCLDTLQTRAGATVATPEMVREMGGGDLLDRFSILGKAFQSDLIRLWLLHTFGGVWMDADMVAVNSLDPDFLEACESMDLVGCWNPHQSSGWAAGGMLACPFGGRQGSPVFAQMMERCERYLEAMKARQRVLYGQTSVGLLSAQWKHQRTERMVRFPHWKLHRVPYYKAREVFLRRAPHHLHERSPEWNPNACLYHLTNPIPDALKKKTKEEVLNGPWFVSFLIRKGLRHHPCGSRRGVQLTEWLEDAFGPDPLVRVAEVGVLRGETSRTLLTLNRNLELLMVDPLDGADPTGTWAKTEKGLPGAGEKFWVKVHGDLLRATRAFGDRAQLIRKPSRLGAQEVPTWSLDGVFIDAVHSYVEVKADLQSWWPKLKEGGLMMGHDYQNRRFRGLTQAVQEFAREKKLAVVSGVDNTFKITKPTGDTDGEA